MATSVKWLNQFWKRERDSLPMAFFRICLGILITAECWGALATGWVNKVFVITKFNFTFIGFEWLSFIHDDVAIFIFAVMGALGVAIALGWRYRLAMLGFLILWTAVYLVHKTSYNNHYYLLSLLCFLMLFIPASRRLGFDSVKHGKLNTIPAYCYGILVLELAIVYFYASIAKMYPDWLNGVPLKIWFKAKEGIPIVGPLIQGETTALLFSWGGIAFDLLVIPLLIYKPTRNAAFVVSICFHLFNSAVFQIGIFPYLMLATAFLLFDDSQLAFLQKTKLVQKWDAGKLSSVTVLNKAGKFLLIGFFVIQILLPLRHWLIDGDVIWTEEGHRLAWRMMLRTKSTDCTFYMQIDDQPKEKVELKEYLSYTQMRLVGSKPDMTWQFAQKLKAIHGQNGHQVKVFADHKVSLNRRPYAQFTDSTVDLASVNWNYFGHQEWLVDQEF